MPDGLLQWIDTDAGTARIVRGNRAYPARLADVEPPARHQGVRVQFAVRDVDGAQEATHVRLAPVMRRAVRDRASSTTDGQAGREPVLTVLGDVPPEAADYAVAKVAEVVEEVGAPVLFSRVKIAWTGDPAVPRRARAEAALDVDGTLVRARAFGHDPHEAVDLLQKRLRDRITHRADRERRRAAAMPPEPGEWRHGNLPTERAPFFDRPVDEREVVRHKSFEPAELTIEEAAWDMALADDAFILFADLAAGRDALLWQDEDHRLHYRAVAPDGAPLDGEAVAGTAGVVPVVVDEAPAPRLSSAEARERLDAGNEPFVFYASADSGRGNVLYRRYDGHYGLITPAESSAP